MKTYFILDTGRRAVKIGRSRNPEKRLRQLQTASADELKLLLVLDGDHERLMHSRWDSLRMGGEWFKAEDSLLCFVYAKRNAQLESQRPPTLQDYSWRRTLNEAISEGWLGRRRRTKQFGKRPVSHKKAVELSGCLPFARHRDILQKVYGDYQLAAFSAGATSEMLVAEVTADQSFGKAVPAVFHAQVLRRAREVYAKSLASLLASTCDTVGAPHSSVEARPDPSDQAPSNANIVH